MKTTIIFGCAAINVPFIVMDPSGNVINWAAAVFCFGLGIANAIRE